MTVPFSVVGQNKKKVQIQEVLISEEPIEKLILEEPWKKNIDYLPRIIVDACNCQNRVINSDSVYSFLQNAPLDKIAKSDALVILVGEPLPWSELASEYKISRSTLHLYHFTKEIFMDRYNKETKTVIPIYKNWTYKNDEILPLESFNQLFAAAWDSTTTYTPKIDQWDIFRIRDNWFTENQYEKLNNQIRKVNKVTPRFDFMRFTIPVFDESYTYALMICDFSSMYIPLLFKREENGWVRLRK